MTLIVDLSSQGAFNTSIALHSIELEQLNRAAISPRADQVKDLRKDELRDTMRVCMVESHIAILCGCGGLTSADLVNNGSVVSYAQGEVLMDIVKRVY